MKTRIRPYTSYLLKQNLSFLIAMAILISTTLGLGFFVSDRFNQLNTQLNDVKKETTILQNKKDTLNTVVGESAENLDQDIQTMTTLIPDHEDYFSIITALESLSQQTGFTISSYTIDLLTSNSTRLSLAVVGSGSSDSFLQFLRKYQVAGGRLITAEKISLDPQETGGIRLNLNFYNRQVTVADGQSAISHAPSLDELNKIKAKISYSLTSPPTPSTPTQDYSTKTNPF